MLGRPVARRLADDPSLSVRAFVRDEHRARKLLPKSLELRLGDLRDERALDAALDGVDAVYLNLNTPFSPKAKFDPDRDGTRLVIESAKRVGVQRILRLSALEVPGAATQPNPWWALRRKADTDRLVATCGLTWTIFRPTWFMESLALFIAGPLCILPPASSTALYWISGADYADQVASALCNEDSHDTHFVCQGTEAVPMRAAAMRFRRAFRRWALPAPAPRIGMALAGLAMSKPRYFLDLIDYTNRFAGDLLAQQTWKILGEPKETIEDYARSIAQTGDFPRK